VSGQARAVTPRPGDVEELLPLALSRPREALAAARAVLARRPAAHEASIAHQAVGIVLREFGDVEAGVRELRKALHLARRTRAAGREADVLATLGVGLAYAGRTRPGLAALDEAVRLSRGVLAARVRVRRGIVLWTLGRYLPALDDARCAVTVLRRAGDRLWTARALNTRAVVYLALGATSRADADFAAAGRLHGEAGQELEAIYTVLNRASVAFTAGDLPAALALLDEAGTRWRPLGVPTTALSIDRCAVLLAAGLVSDALAEAQTAVREMERTRGRSTKKAELLLMAANCALAAAQPETALDWAQAAYRLFRSQHSAWWQAHAARAVVQARYSAGHASARLLSEASRMAGLLDALGSSEAAQAHLLAGRVALDTGRRDEADRHFAAAAQGRRRGRALSRASGWLGAALRAEAAGRPRQLLAACREGLAVLDAHQHTLGASELRAQATAHGAELAALAQRHALRVRQPRLLLTWSERWRATALAVPVVLPYADTRLNADLAALRAVTKRLDLPGVPSASLKREQQRLEDAVRARALRVHGGAGTGAAAFSPAALLEQLGGTRLVEIAEIDGALHVLVCGAGRVRQFTAGRTVDAVRAAAFARFALRRLARDRPGGDMDSAQAILAEMGPKLQDALLGPAARFLGDGPVVIIPPGKLHTIPWPLLPELRDLALSVAPSATAWMRADSAAPPPRGRVALIRGPGLGTEGAEVPVVASLYDDVTMLAGKEATAENALAALDGARLAHIAAHGSFRADSPLFSALSLNDGPLTVYDFEQLRRAPYRLVLSSCDSGVLAPAGSDELLGLVSSLLPLGTAGIIAAVVPINDRASVPMMTDVHRELRAGRTLAQSLAAVRGGLAADPVRHAAAMSLVALGAA
jgi:tetratricopeptide (TPR) repeat protein